MGTNKTPIKNNGNWALLKEKQLKVIQEWMTEKIEDTYINLNRDSKLCDFNNNWLKI